MSRARRAGIPVSRHCRTTPQRPSRGRAYSRMRVTPCTWKYTNRCPRRTSHATPGQPAYRVEAGIPPTSVMFKAAACDQDECHIMGRTGEPCRKLLATAPPGTTNLSGVMVYNQNQGQITPGTQPTTGRPGALTLAFRCHPGCGPHSRCRYPTCKACRAQRLSSSQIPASYPGVSFLVL